MTVSTGQIKAMGDIIAKMNRALSDDTPDETMATPAPKAVLTEKDANVAAMSEIMARFRSATNDIRETAQTDEVLMEALQTEKTETGVRIAEWNITIHEHAGRPGKFYDITTGDICIASDLRLYEAARLLTHELNAGASITSPVVRNILELEEQYSKNLDDVVRYSRIAKTAQGQKREIAKMKLEEARSNALLAKKRINEVR